MSDKPYKHALGTIELLKSTNYATWKRSCRRILEGIRAWNIVTGEEVEPNIPVGFNAAAVAERAVLTNYLDRRAHAAAIISESCSQEVEIELEGISDPAQMWMILAARMDAVGTAVGRMMLLWKFQTLKPTPGEPIQSYFSQLMEIKNQLVGSDEAISDASFKTHIFTTLPSIFSVTVEILQSRVGITVQEVIDALKECERNKAMMIKPDAVSEALNSQQSEKGKRGQGRRKGNKWCSNCKATSHDTEYCWKLKNQEGNKRKRKSNQIICYYCGDEGHTQKDCPIKRRGQAARSGNRGSFGRLGDDGPGGSGSGGNRSGGNGSGRNGSSHSNRGNRPSGNGNEPDRINGRHLIANEPNDSE